MNVRVFFAHHDLPIVERSTVYAHYFLKPTTEYTTFSTLFLADSIAAHVQVQVVHVVVDVGDVPLVRAVRIFVTGALVHYVRLILIPLACRERERENTNKNVTYRKQSIQFNLSMSSLKIQMHIMNQHKQTLPIFIFSIFCTTLHITYPRCE